MLLLLKLVKNERYLLKFGWGDVGFEFSLGCVIDNRFLRRFVLRFCNFKLVEDVIGFVVVGGGDGYFVFMMIILEFFV